MRIPHRTIRREASPRSPPARSLPSVRASLGSRSRIRALSLLWRASRGLSLAAVAFVITEGALPVLVLMGRVVAAIPGAVVHGLGSSDGHHLVIALAEAGAVYALSLLRGPLEDALTAA